MIKSGAVFVFSVAESGIKRWTGKWERQKHGRPIMSRIELCSDAENHHRWYVVVAVKNPRQFSRESPVFPPID